MGRTGLNNALELQKVNNYYDLMLNSETYRYIFRILAIKEIIENYEKYGFHIDPDDYYQLRNTYNLEIDTSINNLANFSINLDLNYKIIKQLNPWIRGNTIPNQKNKKYILKIPTAQSTYLTNQDTIIHICKTKESLFEVARKYNVKIEDILLWNKLLPSKRIKKNQEIIILQQNGN
tara:strand:- start:491 stop:1021 length:531 start_codon:yes stop_codon:yes gene_type:complete